MNNDEEITTLGIVDFESAYTNRQKLKIRLREYALRILGYTNRNRNTVQSM
ncbi:MAG: hypothetical protein M3Q26_10860 [Acidobacteriota bacterium]|nr:hypothetical protein [Acidobacteriota bacterium]